MIFQDKSILIFIAIMMLGFLGHVFRLSLTTDTSLILWWILRNPTGPGP